MLDTAQSQISLIYPETGLMFQRRGLTHRRRSDIDAEGEKSDFSGVQTRTVGYTSELMTVLPQKGRLNWVCEVDLDSP
jgi:hypothetical protein